MKILKGFTKAFKFIFNLAFLPFVIITIMQSPKISLSVALLAAFALPALCADRVITCFNETSLAPPNPPYPPMTQTECKPIFDRINQYSGANTARNWYQQYLPSSFSDYDTGCSLQVAIPPPALGQPALDSKESDSFSNAEIAKLGQDIVDFCFKETSPLRGGEVAIGPKGIYVARLFKTKSTPAGDAVVTNPDSTTS